MSKPAGISDKHIEFTVLDTGELTIQAVGFSDGSCQRATAGYEAGLGQVISRKITGPDCKQKIKAKG